MRYILIICIFVLIEGCSDVRFGHVNHQTLIDVRTTPHRLRYYVIDQADAEHVIIDTLNAMKVGNAAQFTDLLNKQLGGLISNTSVLNYSAGSYILAVRCPKGFQFQHFDAKGGKTNFVTLVCQ
ncbi:hypothetical protein [Desulfobacter postgatei]|uniref:hypothetical protein n=1 Tax=Desulfobacter postgatei TaxID=2293 RepID=UPI00259BF30F|nr:hypothetical protein [uncultured Desulfobacter sp.]